MRHGIDLKTHSQCQRRESRSLATRPSDCSGPDLISFTGEGWTITADVADLVERIGIEPMTSSLQS